MLARLVVVAAAALTVPSCVPEVESGRVARPYPLMDFVGADTLPAAPEGTLHGVAMSGPWQVVEAHHVGGDPTIDHMFVPGWLLLAGDDMVSSVQGVPPEWLLPTGLEWRLNRVDDRGLALGFGFASPRGNIDFLHYAFVMAAVDVNHARAIEAVHFEDSRFGLITWTIWSLELERVQRPPKVITAPDRPRWPE